jgi:uncharacterized protein (TIGR03435 family)
MLRLAAVAFLVVWSAGAGQFDAASIHKSSGKGGGRGSMPGQEFHLSPVTLTAQGVTLRDCIRWACNVNEYQVTGPDWIESERYDITGKSAEAANTDEFRVMMQGLLADRFGLQFHRETKVMSTWMLSVGKNGPKFKESDSEGDSALEPEMKTMSISIKRAPISQLVAIASKAVQAPVLDMTELKGRYDVTIQISKYLPQPGDGPPDVVSILQRGLQEELGLKLESKKVPLDLLVVDHAERAPAEN